ncbi:YIP1 family protein [Dictyobacter arantiisoli]|uniref:Yip1 domain-containing protein n=1 Tax=Dictyobacter arantiisoli TaxID=2014874 RepID=A0A5A5T5D5_9CHLR|nr:YIP1 family protein [Dictyobacter arantiisoli]GCF06542.1 hypothetical protein KDI_01060 [Dictyobacter arantiisoli]
MSWNAKHQQAGGAYAVRPGPSHTPVLSLLGLYARAILRPSARTFARAAEYARWPLIWIQLAILVAIPAVLGAIRGIFHDHSAGINTRSNVFFALLDVITVGATLGAFILKIILVPILFIIGVTLQFVIARALGGRGHFAGHAFSMLLYQVPLTLIGSIIITAFVLTHTSSLFFAPIVSLIFLAYGILINVFVIRGVHNLSRDKAILSIVIPYVIGALVICGGLAAVAHYVANSLSSLH